MQGRRVQGCRAQSAGLQGAGVQGARCTVHGAGCREAVACEGGVGWTKVLLNTSPSCHAASGIPLGG